MNINLYFVRHGQAYHNINSNYYSSENIDALLTPVGMIQSEEVGIKLKDIKFSSIYCSPLSRCIQTCNNILKYNNHNSNYIINFHDYIQEYPYNEYSNKRKSKKILGDYYIKSLTGFNYNDNNIYDNNNQDLLIEEKIIKFLKDLKKNLSYGDNNILIVSHGNLLKKMITSIFKRNIYHIDNCDILTLNNKDFLIDSINVKYAAICLITNDNKILFVRDRYTQELMIPGGHLEKTDETIFSGAYREFMEETTLKLDENKIISKNYYLIDKKDTIIIIIKYNMTPNKSFIKIDTNETDGIYFLNFNEINKNNYKLKDYNIKSFNEMFSKKYLN